MGYGAGNSAMLKNFSKKVVQGNEIKGLLRGLRGDGDHDDIDDGEEMVIDYDTNPPVFQKSNNLEKDYFSEYELEEIEDDRIKYRYFSKLDEDIKRIKKLLV